MRHKLEAFNSLFEMRLLGYPHGWGLGCNAFNSLFEMLSAPTSGGHVVNVDGVTFNSLFEMRTSPSGTRCTSPRAFNSLFEMLKTYAQTSRQVKK